jgi:DNA-binding CsgD family transcriptional regulator
MQNTSTERASDIRDRFRALSRSEVAATLFGAVADCLIEDGLPNGAAAAMAASCLHLGATHSALMRFEGGRLDCVTGQGAVPGRGTRLSPSGAVQAVLQWPPVVLRQSPVQRPWVCFDNSLGYEWVVPCAIDQRIVGIAVWAGPPGSRPPNEVDERTLLRLGALLAAAMMTGASRGQRRAQNRKSAGELDRLTPREQQVMSLLPRGYSNAQIAQALGMATGTAKIHVERILRKLNLQDRAHAAARAVELRLGDSE